MKTPTPLPTPLPTPFPTPSHGPQRNPLWRLLRHRCSEMHPGNQLPQDALQRLGERVTASEQSHTGQIRIVTEGGLPWSYLWRKASARERALMLFSKYRVWDTAHNNGVLIYLLMSEHAIEIVADRGLAQHVRPDEWQAMVAQMSTHFQQHHYEQGLALAIDAVTARLSAHFPRMADSPIDNELPDAPVTQ